MKYIFEYIVQNSVALITLLSAFVSGVSMIIRWVYKGVNLFSERKIKNNKCYINDYSDFIGDENKKYIKHLIDSEIMFKITKIKSPKLRNIISKLENNDVRPDYIRDIKKLNFYVSFDSDCPIIKTDFYYKLGRLFELIMGSVFFISTIFVFFIVCSSDSKNLQGYTFFIAMIFIAFIGFFSVNFMMLSPSRKRIKKLNEILSRYKSDD